MSASGLIIEQRPVMLGRMIGKGAEGEIYLLDGDSRHAVKIYTGQVDADREPKITAMIRAGLAAQAPQVAFPLAIARRPDGSFAGFRMRLVPDHLPLHELYSPGPRRSHFPHADYRFIVRAALNIARATAAVHRLGCVIGDINHSSILISRKATAALIDADSFQLSDQGNVFRCKVGVPEYTPPELQGLPLREVSRSANHDAFGLAVVIFQMLFMGRHPFVGRARRGEAPELAEAIRTFRFAYTTRRETGLMRPPGSPALAEFPVCIVEGFESAFDAATGDARPSAQAWMANLQELEKGLVQCRDNDLHWYPGGASGCLWCAMEKVVATSLFLPCLPSACGARTVFDPGVGGFDLAAVWRDIEDFVAIERLERLELKPALPRMTLLPSVRVRRVAGRRWLKLAGGAVLVVLAVGLSHFWPLWAALSLCVWLIGAAPGTTALSAAYASAQRQLEAATAAWQARLALGDIQRLLARLRQARAEYVGLMQKEQAHREQYRKQRRARALHAYLESFEICGARIRGIGPAKQATLASHGIKTAAAVDSLAVLGVPGFGPLNASGLLSWRRSLEARFVYDERVTSEVDRRELARISADIQARGATLRKTLLAGRKDLEAMLKRTKALATARDPALERAHFLREQARADLLYLGGRVPRP
jgi:DNA-binding helix-hairpin-helix protein with protein kinase domain